MKSSFSGYYNPSEEQYERLWSEGKIVLDTNVLLNLYRLPAMAREDFFGVLDALKERLWIPHQVALEFQRRRLTVIVAERKSIEEALKDARESINVIKSKVERLQIEKRGLDIDPAPLLDELQRANSELVNAIDRVHRAQLDISAHDPIRERIDNLFDGRVGKKPKDKLELDKLIEGGEERYRDKIPPGFEDADKDKNQNESIFIFDHIKYQRKFGDLILWRQLVEEAKHSNFKAVLFVTQDLKEDWWSREQGKTVGPHPELVREIEREGGVEIFWMYSSGQFIKHANQYSKAKVSDASVDEINHVASDGLEFVSNAVFIREKNAALGIYNVNSDSDFSDFKQKISERCFEKWLLSKGQRVERNPYEDSEFLISVGEGWHGYEVKYVVNIIDYVNTRSFGRRLFSGAHGIKEGRLRGFTMVLVVDRDKLMEVYSSNLGDSLGSPISRFGIDGIMVGTMDDEEFFPAIHYGNGEKESGEIFW